MKKITVIISILHGLILTTNSADWGYSGSYGPDKWSTITGYETCAGNAQSPINFPKNTDMEYDASLEDFTFVNFHDPTKYTLTLKNNGHSAKVEVQGDVHVQGGSLGAKFKTAQFHFHWGGQTRVGSEHTYNGMSYPIELHIVNFNEAKYGDLNTAVDKPDGLAVLGYFFEVSSADNPKIAPMINLLSQIPVKDNSTTLSNFPLTNILGMEHGLYYRYQGSLTTPPCYESVKWTVFYEKLMISENQLQQFRSIFFDDGRTQPMVNNYRPPQPLNSRTVYTSFQPTMKWSYHGNYGPDQWKVGYPECSKSSQSPIDLPPWMEMEYSKTLAPFTFENFKDHTKYNLTLKNNGHAAQVDVDGDVYVSGGNLGGKYKTAQFHFHWGNNDMRGSEHTYNKQSFPMELHIVNYNYAKYKTLGEAASKPDGLAVLGYFFEVSDIHNCNFAPILDKFSHIAKKDDNTPVTNFKLSHILGTDHSRYYRYQGSLTTPPCYESVTWTVFFQKLPISVEQLATFRNLFEDKAQTVKIVDNWRPPMPRNDRKVYISFSVDTSGAPSVVCFSFVSIVCSVILSVLSLC